MNIDFAFYQLKNEAEKAIIGLRSFIFQKFSKRANALKALDMIISNIGNAVISLQFLDEDSEKYEKIATSMYVLIKNLFCVLKKLC